MPDLSTIDLNNLSHSHLRGLKELRVSLLGDYHDLLHDIIRASDGSISWLVCSSTSRDPYLNDLFRQFCLLVLAARVVEQDPAVDKIVTPTLRQAQVLTRYFSARGSRVTVNWTETRGQRFRLRLAVLWERCLLLRNLVRMFRCRSLNRRAAVPLNKPITLVDTFVLSASTSAGKYVEAYYAGMLDQLSEEEKASIYFLPTVLERYLKSTFVSLAGNSQENLIFKHDHLRLSDYLFALASSLVRRRVDFGAFRFQGIPVADMLLAEFRRNRFHKSSILALLDYRVFRRLKLAGVEIRLAIDWFENQVLDRGFNKGLRDFYPRTPCIGYQGFTLSTDVIHYIMPTEYESRLGLAPDEIAVAGARFVGQPRTFNPDQRVTLAPAFRSQDVWRQLERQADSGQKAVLVALPITIAESYEIVDLVCGALRSGGFENVTFHIKPHPSLDFGILKNRFGANWPAQFKTVGDTFDSCLARVNLVVSNSSGTCLETLARGIPVIVVGTQVNVLRNPIPKTVTPEFWRMCCSEEELGNAIQHYLSVGEGTRERYRELGGQIRAGYFEPVTEQGVRAFLKLETTFFSQPYENVAKFEGVL